MYDFWKTVFSRKENILLALLSFLYLIPATILILHGANPLDFYAQAAFLVTETTLACSLSIITVVCCVLLFKYSEKLLTRAIAVIGLLLPTYDLVITISHYFF